MDNGLRVISGPHMVFEDQSELEEWFIVKDNDTIGRAYVHFIDQHYGAIMDLDENVSDEHFIRALLKANEEKWAVAVEPVLLIVNDESSANKLLQYTDEFENEKAKRAYEHYLSYKRCKVIENILFKLLETIIKSSDEDPINRIMMRKDQPAE